MATSGLLGGGFKPHKLHLFWTPTSSFCTRFQFVCSLGFIGFVLPHGFAPLQHACWIAFLACENVNHFPALVTDAATVAAIGAATAVVTLLLSLMLPLPMSLLLPLLLSVLLPPSCHRCCHCCYYCTLLVPLMLPLLLLLYACSRIVNLVFEGVAH